MNPKKHKDQKSQYGILSANSLTVTTGIQGLQIVLLSCAWKVIFTLRTHNPRNMSISFTRLSENQLKDPPSRRLLQLAVCTKVNASRVCEQWIWTLPLLDAWVSLFLLALWRDGRLWLVFCVNELSVCVGIFSQIKPFLSSSKNQTTSLVSSDQHSY